MTESDRHLERIEVAKQAIMEWFAEQMDAVKDIIHLHRCVSCQIATAQTPVIIVEDTPQGAHVVVVGVCDTCNTGGE